MQKNGGINPQTLQNNPNMLNGFGGLGGFGGFPSTFGSSQPNGNSSGTTTTSQNPMGGMMGNPFFSMMGSGFGSTQGMNNQGGFSPLFSNPLFNNVSNPQNNQPQPTSVSSGQPNNNFMSLFQNIQNLQQKVQDELKYSSQIK